MFVPMPTGFDLQDSSGYDPWIGYYSQKAWYNYGFVPNSLTLAKYY